MDSFNSEIPISCQNEWDFAQYLIFLFISMYFRKLDDVLKCNLQIKLVSSIKKTFLNDYKFQIDMLVLEIWLKCASNTNQHS